MSNVEGPAPHQSHSSQHPEDGFGSRDLGQEQKGYPLLNCFSFWWRLWDIVLEDAFVWLAAVQLFFLWDCPFEAISPSWCWWLAFSINSLISVEFSFFFRPFRNTLTSTDAARLPWWPLHEKAVHLFLHLVSYLLTVNSRADIHIPSMTA